MLSKSNLVGFFYCERRAAQRRVRLSARMRQGIIAAWVLVALLFVAMISASHLTASTALPPGVEIPTASKLGAPVKSDVCAEDAAFAPEIAC